ncbi:MAG: deoxyuridine 5'-triphosphate nucleotidohydrolase [Candidatus Anstonellaceae archaeon]
MAGVKMIINGEEINKSKLVENLIFSSQQQPAGIDLTIKDIYEFDGDGVIDGDNSKRKLPPTKKIEWDKEEKVMLKAGAYKIIFNEVINVPADAIAIAQSRSSLLRAGAATINAVWDPGYSGRSEGLLVVFNPKGITFYKNAKVLQLIFIRLEKEAKNLYQGKYQNENK